MASIENIPPANNDSEMEEGEIVDDLDDLSDISSEEEFLLRQRLQVLENYNCVLERKKAKRATDFSGKNQKRAEIIFHDLSEISATDLEDTPISGYKFAKDQSHLKSNHKQKKTNSHNGYGKSKDYKKKSHRKRRLEVKVISESSEESDDEYRNKRRKLANAVALSKVKGDTSSLKARIEKMMCGSKHEECLGLENIEENNSLENMGESNSVENNEQPNHEENIGENDVEIKTSDLSNTKHYEDSLHHGKDKEKMHIAFELIDLCSEDNKEIEKPKHGLETQELVQSTNKKNMEEQITNNQDSDDDLEVLRQHALETKSSKSKTDVPEAQITAQNKPMSEEDDSDTAELRLICLKSALLKKAIEMKFKQKLRKRLKSKSISLQDDLFLDQEELGNVTDLENNTDIESVDMDIGSDGDDKAKEISAGCVVSSEQKPSLESNNYKTTTNICKEDELEEDEDLLRAKLLTSLSKNLPQLVDVNIVNKIENTKSTDKTTLKTQVKQTVAEEKKFIINLEDSDSEGEHEATKNLTKMHMKLSEQVDFQQKLDLFLKSTRMKVENTKLPDVVQPPVPKPHVKYVAKAVNHLPKSEQIEYKNLVKRMAELEKIKQARQTSVSAQNNMSVLKETLKPRNIVMESTNQFPSNNLEEKIAVSRKNIAEESSKMLKLKEEATKLLQKYKIVATELRNISTAITLNKKEQRTVQNKLSRIRVQHQMLLKSSNFKHSTGGFASLNQSNTKIIVSRLQKENNPAKDEHKTPNMLKAVKVSVVNDLSKENTGPSSMLSVQIDVSSNKKTVKLPKSPDKERTVNLIEEKLDNNKRQEVIDSKELLTCPEKDIRPIHPVVEISVPKLQNLEAPKLKCSNIEDEKGRNFNDYQSPLEAFGSTIWEEDPNAFLCPYEVGGSCRDPDCKFLHPKIPTHQ